MKKNNKGEDINALCSIFSSITEFAGYLQDKEITPAYQPQKASIYNTKEFAGTSSYEEAHNLMMFGDKELQKKIEEAGVNQTRMKLRKMQNRRVVYPSVVGFAPHVPNYIAGVPTSMINARTKKIRQKIVNIFYDATSDCSQKTEDIVRAAANFVSACMMIEAGGVRLNIYCGFTTKNTEGHKKEYSLMAVKIKESGQQFDTLKMVYPLIHPSFGRRHRCRYMEVTEGLDHFKMGYGGIISNRAEIDKVIKKQCHSDVVLTYYQCKYMTVEDIIKAIEKQ